MWYIGEKGSWIGTLGGWCGEGVIECYFDSVGYEICTEEGS